MKKSVIAAVVMMLTLAYSNNLPAQKDQLENTWMTNGNESKIEMYRGSDGVYYGKIAWLKEPIDPETGKPKLDKENPDESKRNQPLLGLVIMHGFEKNPRKRDEYVDGKIYDPSKGRTYCAKITFKGFFLDLHGFICQLGSFFGRTEVWTLDKGK